MPTYQLDPEDICIRLGGTRDQPRTQNCARCSWLDLFRGAGNVVSARERPVAAHRLIADLAAKLHRPEYGPAGDARVRQPCLQGGDRVDPHAADHRDLGAFAGLVRLTARD